MPRQILALSERYYRRLLYGCATLLSVAIVCAVMFLGYSAFTQFRERQIGSFTSKREQIKSEVDRLTARVVQFAEMYARLQHLYKKELMVLDTYSERVDPGEITRSPESLTVVPFSLVIRGDTAADRLRLATLLLLLRQASALPMFNPAEPGVTLDGFIYTAEAGFLAVSPPLSGVEEQEVRRLGISPYISAISAPVDAAFAAERERAARAQGSTGQRVLWMSPALSAPLQRSAVTRLAVRIALDKGFQPVDVFFGVVQDHLEQFARDVIAMLFAGGDAFLDGLVGRLLQLQVTLQHFLGVLADHQLVQRLQVGQAVEHQDAVDQLVSVLHFADGFGVFLGTDLVQAPVLVHAGMQEILVDGCELIGQLSIEQLDDCGIAFHGDYL